MHWQQLQLFTDNEQAEWLGDLLTGIGALAVTMQDGADQPIYEPAPGMPELWQQTIVTALFAQDDDVEASIEQLKLLLCDAPLPAYQINLLAEKDWERAWMDDFKPMHFGHNLWICPSWCEAPDPKATNIMLDPGLAFGTGTHATTSLCLQWLAENPPVDKNVVDYGCGSGILSVAALKLGSKRVWATDINEQALQATLANAEKNDIDLGQLSIYKPEVFPEVKADVIMANILLQPLLNLAPKFSEMVRNGGHLLLSGVLEDQLDELSAAYERFFRIESVAQEQEWLRVICTK